MPDQDLIQRMMQAIAQWTQGPQAKGVTDPGLPGSSPEEKLLSGADRAGKMNGLNLRMGTPPPAPVTPTGPGGASPATATPPTNAPHSTQPWWQQGLDRLLGLPKVEPNP